MLPPSASPGHILARLLCAGTAAVGCLAGSPTLFADVPALPPAAHAPAEAASVPLDLNACIALALQRQPALDAYRASVASARAGYAALCQIGPVGRLTTPDLPYRLKQASLGIAAAEAELAQAEADTVYAVTRTYYSVVYARRQAAVAGEVAANLRFYLKQVEDLLASGGAGRNINRDTARTLAINLALAQTRETEAQSGAERALAALREAIGLEACAPLDVRDRELPVSPTLAEREKVLALALSRRGEVIQAASASEASDLEIRAQAAQRFPKVARTFAAGSDIHARPVPTANYDPDYRPGAVGIEMPTGLAGSRDARVARATALSGRAAAVVEKTRGLIALEAENAFLRWQAATRQIEQTREAARLGPELLGSTKKLFKERLPDPPPELLTKILTEGVLSGQARVAYNEAVFNHILALANLQRITAGGFCPAFLPAPTVSPDRTPE